MRTSKGQHIVDVLEVKSKRSHIDGLDPSRRDGDRARPRRPRGRPKTEYMDAVREETWSQNERRCRG